MIIVYCIIEKRARSVEQICEDVSFYSNRD
jgi:hypothetical protein